MKSFIQISKTPLWLLVALFCLNATTYCFGTSLSLVGNYNYNISGNTVVLQADKIQNNASGGISGTIHLDLWAFSSPYPGTTVGYKLASYSVGQLSGGYYFYNISSGSIPFTSPPPGTWYLSLQVREYVGSGSDGYTTRDYGDFPNAVRVAGGAIMGDIEISGQTSWAVVGSTVNMQVQKVQNICNLGSSGSLRLDLWATTTPYSGSGTLTGYRFGTINLSPLGAGYEYDNINQTVSYVKPPDGRYYVTLTLSEYHNGSYLLVDYLNYNSSKAFGNLPPAPVVNAPTSLTEDSFIAHWSASTGATGYLLDVSTSSSFDSYVPGYDNLDVGNNLSAYVGGLAEGVTYYYRVRAYNSIGSSANSATVVLATPCTSLITTSSSGNGATSGGGVKNCSSTVTLSATPAVGWQFVNWTENGVPVSASATYRFSATQDRYLVANFTDIQKPVVALVNAPAEKATVLIPSFAITGTATDNTSIAHVYYQLDGGAFQPASGTANWTASITCVPGTNIFVVKAVDIYGNESLPVTRHFYYSEQSQITLVVNPPGSGTIVPGFSGTSLEVGRSYSVTAKSGPGQLFAGWTGAITSTNPILKFVMTKNMLLQANFVTNHFIAAKGTYNGLFSEQNNVRVQSAGYLTLTLSTNGLFTGKLTVDGGTNAFAGKFTSDGQALTIVTRAGKTPLTNSFQINFDQQQIIGAVSGVNFSASLLADRVVFDGVLNQATDYAGKFTMALPGRSNPVTGPAGDGYAALSINASGKIVMAGALADGTPIQQTTTISKDGLWPFFAPLYGGKGLVIGWIGLSKQPSSTLRGDVDWIGLARPTAKYYPAGFTNQTTAVGSYFLTPPAGGRLLNLTAGTVTLSYGNLSTPLANNFTLGSTNAVVVSGTNHVALVLNKVTGLISGNFLNPVTRKTTPVTGVLLQSQNMGTGFFLGSSQSGLFTLE